MPPHRHRLFDAVTTFLVSASKAAPLILVLDDLHWADRPTLLLLQHLARRLEGSRLLVIGTYRDMELDRKHPLAEALTTLRRDPGFERVLLRGLSAEDVLALFQARASGAPLAEGASALEALAAREVRRYLYLRTGRRVPPRLLLVLDAGGLDLGGRRRL